MMHGQQNIKSRKLGNEPTEFMKGG